MYKIDFNKPIHIHFIGIGGISMSGLAEILLKEGFTVSGSDNKASELTAQLEAHGAEIMIGQKAENIRPGIDLVVYTAAIHPDNPEWAAADAAGIPMLTRAEFLGQLMDNYARSIAVSGTHGKTTTTSMIAHILLAAQTDPTISVGGMLASIGGNIRVGGSDVFLTEACEYTNSFLNFHPKYSIILNIEEDHMDFFKDLADIRHSFHRFAENTHPDGVLILNSAITNPEEISDGVEARLVTFGTTGTEDYTATDISYDEHACASFTWICRKDTALTGAACGNESTDTAHHSRNKNADTGHSHSDCTEAASGQKEAQSRVTLHVPGSHNISNALAAIAFATEAGFDDATIKAGLESFGGTARRFEYKGKIGDVTLVDDYAHHPTEIRATLTAAKNYPHDRIVCVFQPHTYTRTKAFWNEFADALSLADIVVLADVYAARETDTLGIRSEDLAKEIAARGTESYYFPTFADIEKFLSKKCTNKDLLITMGAGDVYKIGESLLEHAK